ncbi:MAG: dephospho-CoA kinase, partial [Clostridia bacterium]|nr:dephospho-CoA kinase [Clostridia bacterium]
MTQNSLKIAITGGIGSGKSTVSKFIAEQGYKV